MESDQKRALMAVILSGLVLFGWQKFFAPVNVESKNVIASQAVDGKRKLDSKIRVNPVEKNVDQRSYFNSSNEFKNLKIVNDKIKVTFNSDLSSIKVERMGLDLSSDLVVGSDTFRIKLLDEASGNFKVTPSAVLNSHSEFVTLGYGGNKTIRVELKDDLVRFTPNFVTRFSFEYLSKEERLENGQIRLFKVMSESVNEYDLSDAEKFEFNSQWFGVDFNYHLLAISFMDKGNIVYSLEPSNEGSTLISAAQVSGSASGFELVFAKKNYDDLILLGNNLDKSVDFGVLGLLAVPILRGLQFFYNVFPNYGVSIIILTILIRLITFPLQYKSFKSMKKMSLLQPEINKLKEKFKDDPQRLQKETMELFKRSGANPLGGCLPMLLQMPIFFAFYKVLYAAVELVGQPFYFWINDLSEKDPYFVLPVILTVAMFLQQKLTPTTSTDPTQQKVMMFMPIIFGFIMKDMPAGLVLYICVSTIFQMGQQVFVNKAA